MASNALINKKAPEIFRGFAYQGVSDYSAITSMLNSAFTSRCKSASTV